MTTPRTICKPLLLCFFSVLLGMPCTARAQAPAGLRDAVWDKVATSSPSLELQAESPSKAQLASIRSLLRARQKRMHVWECDDDSWLSDLTYSSIPVAPHPVLLVEAGSGCARGGQGANGAMWLIEWKGAKPALIASPDADFNGWLYSVQPQSHLGFHDIVLGWHVSAREAGLSYFRYTGNAYRLVSAASIVWDDAGKGTIGPLPNQGK